MKVKDFLLCYPRRNVPKKKDRIFDSRPFTRDNLKLL
jgi:hypothetical protein